ncbi:MAG: MoaD/ThiS family protein [Propionibacteriaceae bacterium]
MTNVRIRYWAGARAVAGVEHEQFAASTVTAALAAAAAARADDPAFRRVLDISSVLVDGRRAGADDLGRDLDVDVDVEVLPPFAGG